MSLEYTPKGKRNIGQTKTRWSDQQHLQDSVLTGQDPGVLPLFTFMMMMPIIEPDSTYILLRQLKSLFMSQVSYGHLSCGPKLASGPPFERLFFSR
jgi:hypothetical protein